MAKAIAVVISDIHYNITTLPLADAALRQAMIMADDLQVPLFIAGDMHDTKANLRGECINAMVATFSQFKSRDAYVLVGNHCKINEKSSEHSLNFLRGLAHIIDTPRYIPFGDPPGYYFMPYQHEPSTFKSYLDDIPKGSTIIMHQGVHGSKSGEYIQDKSAIPKEWLADYRVISGHYHTRQDIKCGRPRQGALGLMSYIGNPYTLNFAEANDPEKGFQILMDDGILEFVPTNLRKHVVIELAADTLVIKSKHFPFRQIGPEDIVKVKLTGTREDLSKHSKASIEKRFGLRCDFKLELIPLDSQSEAPKEHKSLSQSDLLDSLIDSTTNVSTEQKERIKALWKGML